MSIQSLCMPPQPHSHMLVDRQMSYIRPAQCCNLPHTFLCLIATSDFQPSRNLCNCSSQYVLTSNSFVRSSISLLTVSCLYEPETDESQSSIHQLDALCMHCPIEGIVQEVAMPQMKPVPYISLQRPITGLFPFVPTCDIVENLVSNMALRYFILSRISSGPKHPDSKPCMQYLFVLYRTSQIYGVSLRQCSRDEANALNHSLGSRSTQDPHMNKVIFEDLYEHTRTYTLNAMRWGSQSFFDQSHKIGRFFSSSSPTCRPNLKLNLIGTVVDVCIDNNDDSQFSRSSHFIFNVPDQLHLFGKSRILAAHQILKDVGIQIFQVIAESINKQNEMLQPLLNLCFVSFCS